MSCDVPVVALQLRFGCADELGALRSMCAAMPMITAAAPKLQVLSLEFTSYHSTALAGSHARAELQRLSRAAADAVRQSRSLHTLCAG